ncbi:MAG TPA: hypothetical protein VMH22_03470 [bacterium]|nr:hypothetical protein [bacterium]
MLEFRRAGRTVCGLVLMLCAAGAQPLGSAPAQSTFERCYGGKADDCGYSVVPTSDRGCIVAGSTSSFGAGKSDIYLMKTDAAGDTLWTRTFGGADYDIGYWVQQTQDGGYIIAGTTRSFGSGGYDACLIKTDAQGRAVWIRSYGGSGDDGARSVEQTADGGYVFTGCTESRGSGQGDVYLVRTNARGDTTWTKTFGGAGRDEAFSVRQTADKGFIVVGLTQSFGVVGDDVYLIKTDAQGDTQWTRTFGGDDDEFGYSVLQTADGGYVVAGLTESFSPSEDVYLIRTNARGDTLWTGMYGGANADEAHSVIQTADGGFVVAGSTHSFGAGSFDAYLIRTNARGDTLWTRTFGGPGGDDAWSVAPAGDGGFFVAGCKTSAGGSRDVLIVKTDSAGNVVSGRSR